METYEFTIIATGIDPRAEDFEARFYDAGCDDALVSFQKGHVLVDFAREAGSMAEAIASAVGDVRRTQAIVERVEPDPLVSLSDMAARSELSRSAMTNYFKGHRGAGFPAPKARVTTDSPLWDWSDVSVWLFRQGRVPRDVAVSATAVSAANDLIDCGARNFRDALHRTVEERVASF